MAPDAPTRAPQNFSERSFYLREFYGRTLALALADASLPDGAAIARVLKDLEANHSGVLVLVPGALEVPALAGIPLLEDIREPLSARVWCALRASSAVALELPPHGFVAACHRAALELGLRKLVWLDELGGLCRADGRRASFVDLEQIDLEGNVIIAQPAVGTQIRFRRNGSTGLQTLIISDPGRNKRRSIVVTAVGQTRIKPI